MGGIPGRGTGISSSYQFAEKVCLMAEERIGTRNEHVRRHTLEHTCHCFSQRTEKEQSCALAKFTWPGTGKQNGFVIQVLGTKQACLGPAGKAGAGRQGE